MRVFSLVLVHNHNWQLIVCNSKGANIIAKVEITCSNVIKDAVHQFMRIMKVIMTYDYWICRPSLALNPCKKYEISYEGVHIYFCTRTRNKYSCKSEIVWNVDAMLKVISFSILNMTYDYWRLRPSLALNPSKKHQIIYKNMFIFICVHAWETNTHTRVKLYEMSRSCWKWSVSQFSTCMSLLRHGCQSHSFWNSQDDSQMYTFRDQMNWQFVQCAGHRWRKTKSAWYCFMVFSFVFVKCKDSHHSHPLYPLNTWIYCECKLQSGLIL